MLETWFQRQITFQQDTSTNTINIHIFNNVHCNTTISIYMHSTLLSHPEATGNCANSAGTRTDPTPPSYNMRALSPDAKLLDNKSLESSVDKSSMREVVVGWMVISKPVWPVVEPVWLVRGSGVEMSSKLGACTTEVGRAWVGGACGSSMEPRRSTLGGMKH